MSLTIVDFYLSCEKKEYLYVTDGLDMTQNIDGASQNTYCGKSIPPASYSQGSTMTVKLVTKGSHVFTADYSSADNGRKQEFLSLPLSLFLSLSSAVSLCISPSQPPSTISSLFTIIIIWATHIPLSSTESDCKHPQLEDSTS